MKPSFHRLHGRKPAQTIVWLETLSSSVRDPRCGLRCIPLHETRRMLDGVRAGARMDFGLGLFERTAPEQEPRG